MPAGARGISAVAVNHTAPGKEIYVSQRGTIYPQPILVFDGSGALLRSWGADSISNGGTNGTWGGHGLNLVGDRVWVYDIAAGAVLIFDRFGKLLDVGGHGGQGTGVKPLQYGCVADGDFSKDGRVAYVSDGDGGVNNRVVALNTSLALRDPNALLWISGNTEGSPHGVGDPKFAAPHSVAMHGPTGNLLIADRDNNRTAVLTSKGEYLGEWTCPGLGRRGTTWGVRTWTDSSLDLVFLGVADAPEDGANQWLHILDGSGLTPQAAGPCTVLQSFKIEPALCVTPHEIGVDAGNGDFYLGCVTQNATQGAVEGLLRFSLRRS